MIQKFPRRVTPDLFHIRVISSGGFLFRIGRAPANALRRSAEALPAAATQVREFYRDDSAYLEEAWAAMTVALRDVLTDDVMTEEKETHIAQLSSALGIQRWGADLRRWRGDRRERA
jgi:predicted phage tail protein